MSTFPDGLYEYGGRPVSGRYEAMWGSNKVYFVDYDNGATANDGLKPDRAFKYLDTALSTAGAWDVIYARGRTTADTDGGDPYYCEPAGAANFLSTITQYGLSIIGTQIGKGHGSQHLSTQFRGYSSALATPALKLVAPGMNLENICWRRGGSTVAAVQVYGTAFNSTIYNCTFQKVTTYPALLVTDAYYVGIYNCVFQECALGITFHAAASNPSHCMVKGCNFITDAASTISADIWVNATGTGAYDLNIQDCHFNHVVPTGGLNKYFVAGAASTGMVSNCYTGAAATAVASNFTLNGLTYSGLKAGLGLDMIAT